MIGKVPVGGDAPITVQTMTNTPTSDARATIVILAAGVAISAEGTVRLVAAPLDPEGRVDAFELTVETIWNHNAPTFGMDEGVRWHWTDDGAKAGDAAVHAALAELA